MPDPQLSIYTAFMAMSGMAPPSLEDLVKEASMGLFLIGWAGVGGIFLAGLILGAFITYIVIKED